jgi:alpha-D-xyloside xylohydrolase
MKFTDGFWQLRPGVDALYGRETYDLEQRDRSIVATVPTKVIERRGDTLNRPVLTVTLHAPLPGVIGVRIEHHTGGADEVGFDLVGAQEGHGEVTVTEHDAVLVSGDITATVTRGAPWCLVFTDTSTGRVLTSSGEKSLGYVTLADDAQVDTSPIRRDHRFHAERRYVHEQLSLSVGELIYGLGERFGPLVKNGQVVDIWNADGGTSSEQAYKNVPFHISNRGYGVLVNNPGHVSYEIGSETVERVQFSVRGESLEYYVVGGGDTAGVLERYTALTGRPARLPAWPYGLWLSTSFTTDYDEATVTTFIDGMAERELPLSVFHFDCFWMREFNWCDFEWDPRVFPDPDGMLARLHDKHLRVCVWINPYIGQRSPLLEDGKKNGYLVTRPDGSVWQWDLWQAGMALVDFTNPDATAWYQGHLRRLVAQGVDAFKTDFGERIPLDVDYFDGSSPERMHNLYAQRYNEAVFEVLEDTKGKGEAIVFARSATAGGQTMPVHWGGDNTSSFESMAETLRGGLSLALSGFGYWSHDIGGFEGSPDPGVFKRWLVFGLLSSHTRLHASQNYRVPWLFDEKEGRDEADPQSAVSVTRRFAQLKNQLMPYLYAAGLEAHRRGTPMMRPMQLAFPGDPAVAYLDRQYMLGPDLLVAPVMSADGTVEFYLPEGRWTNWWTDEVVEGGRWRRETHDFDTVPLYVRESAVIPLSARVDRPDHDYLDGLELRVFSGAEDETHLTVTTPDGVEAQFVITRGSGETLISATGVAAFSACICGEEPVETTSGTLVM